MLFVAFTIEFVSCDIECFFPTLLRETVCWLTWQCTYNVTLRRVRATIAAMEKQLIFWVCVCSLTYQACNAHTPYCRLWPLLLCSIFPHYLINGTIFEKKLWNIKCVFLFSLQVLSEKFPIPRKPEYDVITKSVLVVVQRYRYLSHFNETWIFSEDFRKIPRYQISWKAAKLERSCSMRTDKLTWRSW